MFLFMGIVLNEVEGKCGFKEVSRRLLLLLSKKLMEVWTGGWWERWKEIKLGR